MGMYTPEQVRGLSVDELNSAYKNLYEKTTDLESVLEELGIEPSEERIPERTGASAQSPETSKLIKDLLEKQKGLQSKIELLERQQQSVNQDSLERYFEENISGYSELKEEVKAFVNDNPTWAANAKAVLSKEGTRDQAARLMRDVVDLVRLRKERQEAAEQKSNDKAEKEGSVDAKAEMAMLEGSRPAEENDVDNAFKKTRTRDLSQEDYSFFKESLGLSDETIDLM